MCVAHTRRTTTTYHYLKSRLSAIDTAGFFKGQWKENYYVCGAYKKKNDNNVQLPQRLSAIDTAGFFKGEWKENYYVCGAYKISARLSAIDTAGFFKGEWKENYYVCGVYKKKTTTYDLNCQL